MMLSQCLTMHILEIVYKNALPMHKLSHAVTCLSYKSLATNMASHNPYLLQKCNHRHQNFQSKMQQILKLMQKNF